jgi:plasmid stabilization system protein ParE
VPLPTFVIVGAQKSGTTTLHEWLGQVPGVWVSDPKELHYFDQYQRRGIEWYSAQFHPSAADLAWGESTPIYLYRDATRRDLAATLPTAKFVAILREPVARAYSQYWFARSKGVERAKSFAAAIEAEAARLAAHPQGQPASGSYLDRGRYHRQLVDLADRAGRDRIQVHLMEDLTDDPVGVLRRTCEFVGVRDADLDRVDLRRMNAFGARTLNSATSRARALEGDVEEIRQDGRDTYPPIDAALARDLRAQFASQNAELARWLGRDLSAWM